MCLCDAHKGRFSHRVWKYGNAWREYERSIKYQQGFNHDEKYLYDEIKRWKNY